jgi:ABC-type Mn2+/Zn2+ transport system ATPase subunit
VQIRSPRDALREGIGFVPEERKKQGLVLGMQNRENASLPMLERFATNGWVNQRAEQTAVQAVFDRVLMRSTSKAITTSLSGGNQPKVVLSKWLTAESDILMLDEPTRGVDVGAKSELHDWIGERAAHGAAVLPNSSELPELLSVSTRIIVLREGRMQGEVHRDDATQDTLLRMMTAIASRGVRRLRPGQRADRDQSGIDHNRVTPWGGVLDIRIPVQDARGRCRRRIPLEVRLIDERRVAGDADRERLLPHAAGEWALPPARSARQCGARR